MKWVAVMPLRGGSKSIPGKNVKPLAGKPLFAWSLGEAVASGCFDAVYVSTDSAEIGAAVKAEFPDTVEVLDRDPSLATDTASTEVVLEDVARRVSFDVICLIQATSPLTVADDFRRAKERFVAEELDSLLTAVEFKRFLWTPEGRPVNYDPAARPRRQDFAGFRLENGAFYLTSRAVLERDGCRLGGKIGIHEMPADTAVEIDDPIDWFLIEQLLERRRVRDGAAKTIRALVVDVDGTLTDGGMYYGPEGEALKRFDTRDAKGLERLREHGIRVCVISAEDSPAVRARMRKLCIDDYHPGVRDKLTVLRARAREWGIALDAIAYMGDDLGDRECMEHCGFACCPSDAVPEIRRIADYVSQSGGGRGAVRDVCELLLEQRTP